MFGLTAVATFCASYWREATEIQCLHLKLVVWKEGKSERASRKTERIGGELV